MTPDPTNPLTLERLEEIRLLNEETIASDGGPCPITQAVREMYETAKLGLESEHPEKLKLCGSNGVKSYVEIDTELTTAKAQLAAAEQRVRKLEEQFQCTDKGYMCAGECQHHVELTKQLSALQRDKERMDTILSNPKWRVQRRTNSCECKHERWWVDIHDCQAIDAQLDGGRK